MTGRHRHRASASAPVPAGSTRLDGQSGLLCRLMDAVAGDTYWASYLSTLLSNDLPPYTLHLGVFVEPFLGYMLDGRKTVESRFSTRRFAPYHRAERGDVVLIKRSGGPIVGVCRVVDAWFYRL